LSFYKPAKNGHIASSAEAKSTADLEMKVIHTPSEFGYYYEITKEITTYIVLIFLGLMIY